MLRWVILFLAISGSAQARIQFRTETTTLHLDSGQKITAQFKIPKRNTQGKLPVFMIFGGFESADQVLGLIDPPIPCVLASFDYPFEGSRRFVFPGSLVEIPQFKQSLVLTQQGISKLVQVLKLRSDVDSQRIAIVGASFGAPFAIRAASENPDIHALIVVHGFAQVRLAIQHRLQQLWSKRLGWFTPVAAWLVAWMAVGYLNPPMPEGDAPQLMRHQLALMVEAKEDTFIPQESRTQLKEALFRSKAKVAYVAMAGDHLQPGSESKILEILQVALRWLGKQGWD